MSKSNEKLPNLAKYRPTYLNEHVFFTRKQAEKLSKALEDADRICRITSLSMK